MVKVADDRTEIITGSANVRHHPLHQFDRSAEQQSRQIPSLRTRSSRVCEYFLRTAISLFGSSALHPEGIICGSYRSFRFQAWPSFGVRGLTDAKQARTQLSGIAFGVRSITNHEMAWRYSRVRNPRALSFRGQGAKFQRHNVDTKT